MGINIHNSLGNKKETLKPLKGKKLNIYSCGVTVYDKCHIGHARSLYVFEVIRRFLKHQGFEVRFIRNITDIDDKIINRAKELNKDWREVVDENIKLYENDLKRLGLSKADEEPRATDNIPEMITHIQGLIEKGFAYVEGGDVYFNVRAFKDYGKLSGQSIEKMQEAVRIERGEKKKDPLDFALWKASKEGEPFWESPWGKGRPGWHIECSAMSVKYAKTQTLDIHAGGRDLIFPHHENELAQSEALSGKPFAKYWIHHGLLTINAQKMAKSLKNFITVDEALAKYTADELKLFFLSSHYASPLDFNEEKMHEVKKNIERFTIFFLEAEGLRTQGIKPAQKLPKVLKERSDEFLEAMSDDFNTPRALAALFEMISDTYKLKSDRNYPGILLKAAEVIREFGCAILGLSMNFTLGSLSAQEKQLLDDRGQARAQKDFKRSDELREALKALGIIVEDAAGGQKWRRA